MENGFLLLKNVVPNPILKHWQDLAKKLENDAMEAHRQGESLHGVCVIKDPVGPRLMRYDDIVGIDGDACLDLLACPAMMAVSKTLSGRGTVPLQLDVLYKQQHPHPVIKWHQGAPHPRGFPYLNVGVYLDDAPEGDGCLRYVPGTQHGLVDIEKLSADHGWVVPGVVEQGAEAADILIQDMMILHGSQPKRSAGVRRTIYIELRPFDGILESCEQSREWGELRQKWMRLVLERSEDGAWPKEWLADYPALEESQDEILKRVVEEREPATPAVWGIHPVESPNYPVPEDMKDWGPNGQLPS